MTQKSYLFQKIIPSYTVDTEAAQLIRNRNNFESIEVILQFAEKAANGDLNCQRAALSALSVSCEGCADSLIDGNHMPRMVSIFFSFWPPTRSTFLLDKLIAVELENLNESHFP